MINIDFTKYKRFFAFGCSFTGYCWPTWADVLSKEMPHAEFYNMGYSGAGNLMISARITEASLKFNFNKDDLVMVMWTTFCREDRYWHGAWTCPGNIFTQNTYSEDWVKKYADPKGYLLRDLVLITLASKYLKSLPCDSITMTAVPYNYQNENDESIKPILELYKDTINLTPPNLFELEMEKFWGAGHSYYHPAHKEIFQDYHPDPVKYRNYLEKIGLPLTNKSRIYADAALTRLKETKTFEEINKLFVNNSRGLAQFSGWF